MRLRRPAGERKTTCSKCSGDLEGSKNRYCKKCRAEYMRYQREKDKVKFLKMESALRRIINLSHDTVTTKETLKLVAMEALS